MTAVAWSALKRRIHACRRCPRLLTHCQAVAADPPKRFRGETYWGKPVEGFGDRRARVLVVGLAPAVNGANRTGRFFTGDESGRWLFRALHQAGFANQPGSLHARDGLALSDAFVTAVGRCAPPENKLLPAEKANCLPFLLEELRLLSRVRVVVALGQIAWNGYLVARRAAGAPMLERLPKFGHQAQARFPDGVVLLGCYHPSQQNTFTGRLTEEMLREVFLTARELAS